MGKVLKWLDNFWYHYKWETIIAAFFIMVVVVCCVQSAAKSKSDAAIMYTGPEYLSARQVDDVKSAFEQTMNSDYNGDGKKYVSVTDITLMTEAEALEAKQSNKENTDPSENIVINNQDVQEAEKKFNMQVFSGEVVICLLDPYWYNELINAQGLAKLEDVLGYRPDHALDDYGVRLKDTQFGQYFTVFSALPDDTVLCIRTISTVSVFKNLSDEKTRWQYNADVFKDVLNFTFPEGYTPETETSQAG